MHRLAGIVALLFLLAVSSAYAQSARELNLRGDRFKGLKWEDLTPEQRTMVNDILSGTRTALNGPFNTWLRSPEMGDLAQKLGEYLRFHTSVPQRLNELAIMLTAMHWVAQYEWLAHKTLALKAGLSESVIADIAAGKRPVDLKRDEAIVYDFVTEMREKRRVSDATFAAAKDLLGERGIVDLAAVMGYYDLVSYALNLDRYPLPAGEKPPLPEPK